MRLHFLGALLMAWTFLVGVEALQAGTSSTIDTSGADFIVIRESFFAATGAGTVTDSKGNTFDVADTQTTAAGSTPCASLLYKYGPTVGTLHTFTAPLNADISVMAFSGSNTVPLDQKSKNSSASTTSLAPGAITASEDNELYVLAAADDGTGTQGISDGTYTIQYSHVLSAGVSWGGGVAYKIQGAAASQNPAWTISASCVAAVVFASFKVAGAAGSATGWGPLISGLRNRLVVAS